MSTFIIEPNTAGCAGAAVALSEGRLIEAAKVGQTTAFVTLCERCSKRLFRAAHRITRNREDAEDAVQDALLLAFVHLRDFDGRSSFSTWLTRIAINSALMILRRKRATPSEPFEEIAQITTSAPSAKLPDPGPSPEVFYMQRERKRILFMAMKELTPAARKAIELRDLRELSTQETARILRLSVPAVKGRVFHGRRKLRQMLQPHSDSACQHRPPVVGRIHFRSSFIFNPCTRRSACELA